MPPITDRRRALSLARRPQGVTAGEIADAGIHRQVLTRLVAEEELERVVMEVVTLVESGQARFAWADDDD